MNNAVNAFSSEDTRLLAYGNDGGVQPLAAGSGGELLLSAAQTLDITGNAFDIRALNAATDSLSITGTNLDIRDLSGAQDSVTRYGSAYAEDSQSSGINPFSTVIFLTKNVSPYRRNTYVVRNLSLSVAVNVVLQIAPVDQSAYYIDDGSTFQLLGGATVLFSPSRFMKYARISVSALLSLGTVEVRYFGQS